MNRYVEPSTGIFYVILKNNLTGLYDTWLLEGNSRLGLFRGSINEYMLKRHYCYCDDSMLIDYDDAA